MNVRIFEHGQRDLLEKIAESPERFIGLFSPSKPETKILQNLLQSHEIRFGRALEQFIEDLVLFRRGDTLARMAGYFLARQEGEYQELGKLLRQRMERYYQSD